MYPSFITGRTVAGAWEFLTSKPVPRHEAQAILEATAKAKGTHEGVQYVEIAFYDVPRPSQVERFTPPRAAATAAAPPPAPPQASAVGAKVNAGKKKPAAAPKPDTRAAATDGVDETGGGGGEETGI